MAASLTANAIAAVSGGDLNLKPVVQVLDVRLISAAQERYQMLVSDGAATQEALLAMQLSGLVKVGKVKKGSVIQLLEYISNVVQGRRFVP